MSKNATLGMIVKAAYKVPDKYGEVAAKILSSLAYDDVQAAERHRQFLALLEGRSQIVPMPLLRSEGMHLPVLPEAYLIDWDVFQQRPDVYCYDGFKALIQEDQVAKPVERSIGVGKVVLQRAANDTAIRQELPADHPLQLREFVWTILNGGAKQDGSWYVSYVLIGGQVCVVFADWGSDFERWRFFGWGWGDSEWSAGHHVLFSDSCPQTA